MHVQSDRRVFARFSNLVGIRRGPPLQTTMPPRSAAPERSPSPVSIGPVPFDSTHHFSHVLSHIKANVDEEVTRVLHEEGAEGDTALRREIELLVYEVCAAPLVLDSSLCDRGPLSVSGRVCSTSCTRTSASMVLPTMKLIHRLVRSFTISEPSRDKVRRTEIEPYDDALNRKVFAHQDAVADAVVEHTAQRKALPPRRLAEVKTNLAAARPIQPDLTPVPVPTVINGTSRRSFCLVHTVTRCTGELPDRELTLRDFRDALASAQHAQQVRCLLHASSRISLITAHSPYRPHSSECNGS